jgi:chorismate synthase
MRIWVAESCVRRTMSLLAVATSSESHGIGTGVVVRAGAPGLRLSAN